MTITYTSLLFSIGFVPHFETVWNTQNCVLLSCNMHHIWVPHRWPLQRFLHALPVFFLLGYSYVQVLVSLLSHTVLYQICEILASHFPTIKSLTWHPLFSLTPDTDLSGSHHKSKWRLNLYAEKHPLTPVINLIAVKLCCINTSFLPTQHYASALRYSSNLHNAISIGNSFIARKMADKHVIVILLKGEKLILSYPK